MKIKVLPFIIFLVFSLLNQTHAQKDLYHLTNLKDSAYFYGKISHISNKELFISLDLNKKGLEKIRIAFDKNDFENCYAEWSKYWINKKHPSLATNSDGLFIDYDERLKQIKANPKQSERILVSAEKVLNHEINGWGDVILKFGKEIDFNADFGQSGKYGFHYWFWSLPLIDAFILSNDMKYIRGFDTLFNQWFEQRDKVKGGFETLDVIFYELGLGARNKFFLTDYYINNPSRDLKMHENMLKNILGSGRWLYEIEKNAGYRPGNWQAVGALSLALIGLAFDEFKESKDWVETGINRLLEHMEMDFFEDGGHSERSPAMYTLLTYSQIRNLYYLLTAFNYESPAVEKIKNRMGKTINWWITLLTPTAEMPAINDAHKVKFPQDVLIDGAKLFSIPIVRGILDKLYYNKKKTDYPLPDFTSKNLSPSGFLIMREDWSPSSFYLNLNYGKWGGGHSHNGLLDFEIYAFGKAHVIDAGIGKTYDDPNYYPWYQTSNAHNMLVVNDSNLNRKDAFGENVTWKQMKSIEYFSAENNGYKKFGIRHKRHVLFFKSIGWLIFDECFGNGSNNKLTWNLHVIDSLRDEGQYFRTNSDTGLIIYPIEKYDREIKQGYAMVNNNGTSDDFRAIPWLQFKKQTRNEKYNSFSIMLLPYIGKIPKYSFSGNGLGKFNLKIDDIEYEITIKNFMNEIDTSQTDADLTVIKMTGKSINPTIINGSYLKYKGKTLFRNSKSSDFED